MLRCRRHEGLPLGRIQGCTSRSCEPVEKPQLIARGCARLSAPRHTRQITSLSPDSNALLLAANSPMEHPSDALFPRSAFHMQPFACPRSGRVSREPQDRFAGVERVSAVTRKKSFGLICFSRTSLGVLTVAELTTSQKKQSSKASSGNWRIAFDPQVATWFFISLSRQATRPTRCMSLP